MTLFRTRLLLALLAGATGCTSVDVACYRLPRSEPAQQRQEAVVTQPAAGTPHLAAPEPVRPAAPATAPRIVVPAVPTPPSVSSPPAPVTACDPGGCWSAGERYQGGTGDTYLDRNGRLCRGSGGWMQCY